MKSLRNPYSAMVYGPPELGRSCPLAQQGKGSTTCLTWKFTLLFFLSFLLPVLSSAPVGERNHGHAKVHNGVTSKVGNGVTSKVGNGVTCWSVRGISQNCPQSSSRGIHNHQSSV